MPGGVKRAIRAATADWSVGALDRAISTLEPLFDPIPLPPESVYVLARARSERGDCQGALSTLDRPTNPPADPRVVKLFRALILYDHGQISGARKQLEDLESSNPIAGAMLSLIQFGADESRAELRIPRAAAWMADVSGRLLAILESRLAAQGEKELLDAHRPLFLPIAAKPGHPIEAAFVESRYEDIERLHAGDDETGPSNVDYLVFSLIALGKDEKAGVALSRALEERPASDDLHFLCGLLHSRFRRQRDAGWSFVRAARLADVFVGDLIAELSQKLGITIRLLD